MRWTAHWAIAMTEWRPFWDRMPSEDRKQRSITALSSSLHADPSQNEKAVRAYADAMGALHAAHPNHVQAQAFYGLAPAACIGQHDPAGNARKALAVLEPGFGAHPDCRSTSDIVLLLMYAVMEVQNVASRDHYSNTQTRSANF
jgi:hypothetical protein